MSQSKLSFAPISADDAHKHRLLIASQLRDAAAAALPPPQVQRSGYFIVICLDIYIYIYIYIYIDSTAVVQSSDSENEK